MNQRSLRNIILSLLLPGIACAIQWAFWDELQPFVWLLFYPAVFFSAQIGGLWGGLAATLLSATLAVFFFAEPVYTFKILNINMVYSISIFIVMGFVFSNFQERFKREQYKLQESESALRKMNEGLEGLIAERALLLQKANQRFENLVENMLEGAQIIGFDWSYLYLNRTAEIHSRRPNDELLGRKFMDVWPGIESTTLFALIKRCLEEREIGYMENEFTFLDGRIGWFELRVEPIPEGAFILSFDISERKLIQEQLLNTLQELERSNAELEQFAYVASHDLQEPLRAVAGMVQLLQKRYHGQMDERADEYIDLAMDGATRMQTLITDLLEYSRIDRHGNAIQPANANEALKSALLNLEGSIQKSGAVITNETLPTVEADATQLTQLFQNLIGNAIKFCSEITPQIHIGVEELPNAWHFSVRDNGIGIEPQYFDRIFLVFQRLHTRREYPGTGIGLSICKKIVERHGGRIWVESVPGQGTTFFFTIPHRS